jgi:arginase family enzyme
VQDRTIPTFARGYQPAFAGINTFLKAPYLEDVKQVGGHDVAIVGAPFDMGTTFRPGARWAPQAVRQISALYDGHDLDMAVARERGTTCSPSGTWSGSASTSSTPATRRAPAPPEPGGLSSREMLRFISIVAREAPLCGMEVVEVSPP